jgi:hypothetical protein
MRGRQKERKRRKFFFYDVAHRIIIVEAADNMDLFTYVLIFI